MFLGNTGFFQLWDCGYHARWLKIFPLLRNFFATLSIFCTGCPSVVTGIQPCSPTQGVVVSHLSVSSSLSPEREVTTEASGATTGRP